MTILTSRPIVCIGANWLQVELLLITLTLDLRASLRAIAVTPI